MASSLSSASVTPLEYFTDRSETINMKSDVILVVGQERFYCHRLLLSLVSPVFTRMFDGAFREHDSREIHLEGKTSESILELLKYIYPQFHGRVTPENVEAFLLLADEYMIEHLKQPCKDLLIEQLQPFAFVLLPMQHKLEQPSIKSKPFHASDSALDSAPHHEEDMPANQRNHRTSQFRRPASGTRQQSAKFTSSYLKCGGKGSSSSPTHSRYVLFLHQTQMPSFYDKHNAPLPFTLVHVELWLRRLRILYRIDQGRYYDEVAEKILAILQFIPASLLCSVAHLTMETHSNDEAILNDLARARLFMLEEWAADGVAYRPAHLTVSYQTMSPHVLAMTAERAATKTKAIVHKEPSSVQETIPSAMGSGAFHFNFVDDD